MPESNHANLIINGQLRLNTLRLFVPASDNEWPADEANWLIPLPIWLTHDLSAWRTRQHPVALLLEPAADLTGLFAYSSVADLQKIINLIAINFPVYTDGRGYSLAQLLRQSYGWQGELRAVGDVMIDTMHYLARCGFDSFLVKPSHDPHNALAALASFTQSYQKSYRTPVLPTVAA